jgi:hypothetical protein
MAKIKKLKNRLQAIAATKIKTGKKKTAPMGNPPSAPTKIKTKSKKAKAGRPRKDTKDTGKAGTGKGRKNKLVAALGKKYFTFTPKAAGAGGGMTPKLKPEYTKYQIRIGSKTRIFLVSKKKAKGTPGTLSVTKMKSAGISKNGKNVIKVVDIERSKYPKVRNKKVVKTAASKAKSEKTRVKNKRKYGGAKPAAMKGKSPSKAKGTKPKAKGSKSASM